MGTSAKKQIVQEGKLVLGGRTVGCFILNDGTVGISSSILQEMYSIFHGNIVAIESMAFYRGEEIVWGHEVGLFIDVCFNILNQYNMKLNAKQKEVIRECQIIISDLAKIGLITAIRGISKQENVKKAEQDHKLSVFDLALKKGLNFNPKESD